MSRDLRSRLLPFAALPLLAAACSSLGIEVLPDRIDFGSLPVGESDRATVLIVNRGRDVTASLLVQPSSGPFRIEGQTTVALPQDVAVAISIAVTAGEPGNGLGVLTIGSDGGSFDVPLSAEFVLEDLDADRDGVPRPADCDDTDPTVFPGGQELCDGVDGDCDGDLGTGEADGDLDGVMLCEGDCDDFDALVHPGAPELCDGMDGDCDGVVDEDDLDLDGFRTCDGDCDDGNAEVFPGAEDACDGWEDTDCDGQPDPAESDADADGWSACEGDCDDTSPAAHPGGVEACDGDDTDCDGGPGADEVDGDLDGMMACAGDCDDTTAAVHPGAPEACDGIDDDCDGLLAAGEVDADVDGSLVCDGDCQDGDATVFPGAVEACDGIDTDCDGLPAAGEVDADTDGSLVCGGDCDDAATAVHPGAPEACDGIDTDCDGVVPDPEADGDGDDSLVCEGDCDDGDATVRPLAPEGCDGIDTDCDGAVPAEEADSDADGAMVCAGDCDDANASVGPFAADACDGLDTDCDGAFWIMEADGDGDGWLPCSGFVDHGAPLLGGDDCDDGSAQTYPGADEGCDGLDTDCDGSPSASEVDDDLDGQAECQGDCDDSSAVVFDGAVETCDGVDQDCDGTVDDGFDIDLDLVTSCGGDCDDSDPLVFLGAPEACNGEDDDCDGLVPQEEADGDADGFASCEGDCDDTDAALSPAATEILCDWIDNDCSGVVDDGAVQQEFFVKGEAGPTGGLWVSDGAGGFAPDQRFDPAGGGNVYSAIAGDFDGDGFLDFVLERYTNSSGTGHLFRSDCQGGFADTDLSLSILGWGDLHTAADLDVDGDIDLVGWDWSGGGGQVWLNDGTGYGWSRLPAQNWGTRPFTLLYWNASDQVGHESVQIPPADVTGDGVPDLVECGNSGANTNCAVHRGDGDGTFTLHATFSLAPTVNGFAFADVDGDGQPDFVGGLDDDGDAGQVRVWWHAGFVAGWPAGQGDDLFDVQPDPASGNDSDQPGYGWIFPYDWNGDGATDFLVSTMEPAWTATRVIRVAIGDGAGGFALLPVDTAPHTWGAASSHILVPDVLGVPVWP